MAPFTSTDFESPPLGFHLQGLARGGDFAWSLATSTIRFSLPRSLKPILRVFFETIGYAFLIACLNLGIFSVCVAQTEQSDRPNILWLTTEDIGPELNCYGDPTAKTPNLDALANRGLVYDVAWSNYPVCAPARTTIVTGTYAATLGAGNMRSQVRLPAGFKLFPQYLRQAGYYCSNNSKKDYNVISQGKVWDESSRKAHYKNRATGQPFFAVFNFTGTHESKIRKRPHTAVIDPSKVALKSYWPDLPEVRQDWAQYYDNLQSMDAWLGKKLDELKDSGVADNTIVLFFGDHGSGMPRHKRYAGDSGQRVPFVIHVPEKLKELAPQDYKAGGRSKRLVSFVDLAPTMLSVAGIKPPNRLQGSSIMGQFVDPAPDYLHGYRDRMDERPDFSRAVRNEQYIYVRNYHPNLPAGQYINYQQQTPTTSLWRKAFLNGKLNDIQSQFWKPHQSEELYDLKADPQETNNLADDPQFAAQLQQFRKEHRRHVLKTRDLGFIPEGILFDASRTVAPTELIAKEGYQLDQIFDFANQAAVIDRHRAAMLEGLRSDNPIIRYWAAIGLQTRHMVLDSRYFDALLNHVDDNSPPVAIVVAEILATHGSRQRKEGMEKLIHFADHRNSNPFHAIRALNAIDHCLVEWPGDVRNITELIGKLPVEDGLKRGGGYLRRLVSDIIKQHEKKSP